MKDAGREDSAERLLALVFFSLLVPPLAFLFRRLDGNTLVSWAWAMPRADFPRLYLLLIALTLAAAWAGRTVRLERCGPMALSLLAFAAVLPLWRLPELLLDSGRYFQAAKYLARYGPWAFLHDWGGAVWAWTDLPLSSFFYGTLFRLFGEGRLVLQLANTLLFVMTVLLTSGCGRLLWRREVGVLAALLLLSMPLLLVSVPQMQNDAHLMFCLVLTLYCLLRLCESGDRQWEWASALAVALLLLAKYSAWPMLATQAGALALFGRRPGVPVVARLARALAVGTVPLALLAAIKGEVIAGQLHILATYQRQGLAAWQEGYLATAIFQIHPFLTVLAVTGAVRALRRHDRRFAVLAWFPFLALALGLARSRYLLPFAPLLCLAAAYGLWHLGGIRLRRAAVLAVLAWGGVVLYGAYLPFLATTSMANLQQAGRRLDTMEGECVAVAVLPQATSAGSTLAAIPLLDLYTGKAVVPLSRRPRGTGRPTAYRDSLEFTRRMPLAAYYARPASRCCQVVAIIGSETVDAQRAAAVAGIAPLLARGEYRQSAAVFRYKTMVSLFEAPAGCP